MKRLTSRDESGYYHLRRGPKGGEINKITVVQHLGRLEDVALRPVSREQVEKVWRGEWTEETYTTQSGRGRVIHSIKNTCSDCGKTNGRTKTNFCPACGAPMTDEAVEMVMERLEALHETDLI